MGTKYTELEPSVESRPESELLFFLIIFGKRLM